MTYPTYGSSIPGPPPAPQPHSAYEPYQRYQRYQPYESFRLYQTYQPYQPHQQAAWGAPTQAKTTLLLPWLLAGLVALLVADGISLVLLLDNDAPGVLADPPTQGAPGNGDAPAPEPRAVPSPPTDCLVECDESDAPGGGEGSDTGEANYTGSPDAAISFVEAIANGDSVSAHQALCGDGKTLFATPEELIADFYATFGFTRITGARLTDVYAADSTADAVVFDLATDAGDVVVEVYIVEEASSLTVCGYDFS